MAHASSGGERRAKKHCQEDHAELDSGGQHSAVTKRVAHASSGDRPQAKRPCQEEHAHVPPRKRMRCKQPNNQTTNQPINQATNQSTAGKGAYIVRGGANSEQQATESFAKALSEIKF